MTTPELTAEEIKEAEAGKEQLMLALRVASSKLNFAQKKAQEINSENQVHNQHKIG
jgi:F0F1-type ATP synthase membrane subunit b/b'